jgi:pimeloyl-ACP methyl ester carboxylesterase
MGTRRCTAAVIAMAVVALVSAPGCTADDDGSPTTAPAQATTTAPLRWPTPTFVEGACPMPTDGLEVEVTCGTVEVPENRLNPDSATITLAVARLHSRAPNPKPDPVINLQGGPGFASLENVESAASSDVLDERDYIIWDQRGVGFSTPNLDCPEVNEAIWQTFETADPAEAEQEVIVEAGRRCRVRVLDDGVDLAGYTTTQNAADLADLRVALDIDEWHLRAVSYGSALAIETMRNHPEGLTSVLLDSVVPPDAPFGGVDRGRSALASFDQLYQACADDPDCAERYGPLEELFTRAAAVLDATPYETTVEDPDTGTARPVKITGEDLWAGLFNALYDEALIPALPSVGQAVVNGNVAVIDPVAQDGIPFAAGQAEAMTLSVECADRQDLMDIDAVEPFLDEHPELATLVRLTLPEETCPEWGVPSAPPPFNDLLGPQTEVPVLVMAGRFDPITPVRGTEAVAEALGVEVLLFPAAGHGAVGSGDCARSIWHAFLDDPSMPPDTGCLEDLGPPEFL